MKHTCVSLASRWFFCTLAGCASQQREEAWIELTQVLGDYAQVLDSARDEASAKAAAAKIPPLADRYRAVRRKIESLPAPTLEEERSLDRRFGPAMRDIRISTLQSMNRIEKDPVVSKIISPALRGAGGPK
jgi:hypothetical protein